MDGALRPNSLLDGARVVADIPGADNVVAAGGVVYCSSGPTLYRVHEVGPPLQHTFEADIGCVATLPDDRLVVALENGRLHVQDGAGFGVLPVFAPNCPTAMVAADSDTLIVTQGSTQNAAKEWCRDLLNDGHTGGVWRIHLPSETATLIARGLRYAAGLTLEPDRQSIVVSESWRHRLVRISLTDGRARPAPVTSHLPGYPSRIATDPTGDYWLTIFAPRSQLMELVLREPLYKQRMMDTIAPEFWMAPALASGRSFKEPLQGGAIKTMGVTKPWAPTRSYGLLVQLDHTFRPRASYHSRADGTRHGITSCARVADEVWATSKGAGALLALPAPAKERARND